MATSQATAEAQGSTSPVVIPWDRLKVWIAKHEAWERTNQRPAPLTAQELAAVSQLVSFDDEPVVDDKNFVGDLNQIFQARQQLMPSWSQEPVQVMTSGHSVVKWRVFCSIQGTSGRFPCPGFGMVPNGEAPAFQNKKKAKQYAAQQALAYLSTLKASSASTSSSNPMTSPDSSATRNAPSAASAPSSKRLKQDQPRTPANGREPTVFDDVRVLAEYLHLGNPTYELRPDGELGGQFWSARAKFKIGSRVPDDVGIVQQIFGKDEAKAAAAQEILVWLQREKQRRHADLALLHNLRPEQIAGQ